MKAMYFYIRKTIEAQIDHDHTWKATQTSTQSPLIVLVEQQHTPCPPAVQWVAQQWLQVSDPPYTPCPPCSLLPGDYVVAA